MGTVGVAPGTTTLQLPDGSAIQLSDWIDDRYYSTVQLTNGQVNQVEAFSSGRSQPIPGGARASTRVDTNITRAGDAGLGKDFEMLIYSIGVRMVRVMRAAGATPTLADFSDPPRLQTLFNVDRVTFLTFEYNQKVYSSGVTLNYPQGLGFNVFGTTANIEIAQNGRPSPQDRNSLVLPIHMRENLSYKMVFQPEAALAINQLASDGGANLTFADVKVELIGLIKRPVV